MTPALREEVPLTVSEVQSVGQSAVAVAEREHAVEQRERERAARVISKVRRKTEA
jgi:hypothetical protein